MHKLCSALLFCKAQSLGEPPEGGSAQQTKVATFVVLASRLWNAHKTVQNLRFLTPNKLGVYRNEA